MAEFFSLIFVFWFFYLTYLSSVVCCAGGMAGLSTQNTSGSGNTPGTPEVSKLQQRAAVEALKSSAEVLGVALGGTMDVCTSCEVHVLNPQYPCY